MEFQKEAVEKLEVGSRLLSLRADQFLSRMSLGNVDSLRTVFPAIKFVQVDTHNGDLEPARQDVVAEMLANKVRLGEWMKGSSGSDVHVVLTAYGGEWGYP